MQVSSHSRDYDVLLSYRGQDTRRTLVGHLYTALQQLGISTYLDIDDHVSSSEVIEQSEIAVIVFSKNYADSLRCLDQLAYIMKCREERGQTNLSVFYDVDPSEVIDQGRKYKEAFQIRELENEKIVESWRKSLTDAACISGWQVDCQPFDGQESRCIEEIVDTISRKLHPVLSSSNEDLILTEIHTQDQKSSSSQPVRASSSHSWDYDAISFRGE
ncbi:TMV resistance protein N-like [Bidens hawaiensis]|uniref:TMV resistance protein N-like n=1 Tax=Bidens hawaiensis TaxID=980011 RepID=UPI00404B41C7